MANDQFISLKDMMLWVRTGKPFSFTYVTFNVQKGSGGAVKQVSKAVISRTGGKPAIKTNNYTEQEIKYRLRSRNNFSNGTLTYKNLTDNTIREAHVMLVRVFNGLVVK